ncbi:hypothetical protein Fmac_016575 [Flemingia macrophylla]|uniref:Leucine-rich repeat-containing N-terminal plant-type domain-containing protein n=1 Tax=Flemingia macrophylla TaxID=520843 RepID=A0ABD1MHV7_9FABA
MSINNTSFYIRIHCRFSLFCMLTVLCIYLCVGSSPTNKCVEIEKQALLKLKDSFFYGRHILSSWNGDDCCGWKGISCNNLTAHVTRLDIRQYSNYTTGDDLTFLADSMPTKTSYNIPGALGGEIDSSICELHHLTFLDLNYNDLIGEIRKCIGLLGELVELKLARNQFRGSIPHTLANLSNLQTLDLRHNYNLEANDLEWLSHLSNLRYLDLSNVYLGSVIDWPSSIGKLPSLLVLYLNDCGLPQVNPKSISHMNSSTSLQILGLSRNTLNSSILSWVLNVSKVLTVLDLSQNEIDDGIIKSFQHMCQLKELYQGLNKLFGKLSDYLPEMCFARYDVEVLDLEHNPFSSGLLPDFSWYSSLKRLSLKNTSIVGPLSVGHLPRLEALDLSSNHLNGSLTIFEVTKFDSLHYLDLSHNELSGTLPYTIGQLSKLWFLSVSSNKLNGIISETHLLNLSKLELLDLSENSLSFNLNPNWVPPFQLLYFLGSPCTLGPQFPTWLRYQKRLLVLQIFNTSIMDSFPKWFGDISSSLSDLNVSHNKLSGVLPSIKTGHMSKWDFSFNNLSGPLPPFPPNVFSLSLSNNMFSGSVSSICAMSPKFLTYLDLSSNLLVGPLPNCWEKYKYLKVLNFNNNSLSGRIPTSFGSLEEIQFIRLNNNKFSGEIPSFQTPRMNLRYIDFGDNILEGTLPTWFSGLSVLLLGRNKIQGGIPTSICEITSLRVLDLSSNNITGEIPQCLNSIRALSDVNYGEETFSYYIYEAIISNSIQIGCFGDCHDFYTIIDLAGNKLTGEIPESLTTLRALIFLNLSGNNLTGIIPNNIDHMQMLEALDLSRNHLYGRIPSSFSNLIFLTYMNLSSNNLSGEIPTGHQLNTFDNSTYAGNNGLCGIPLSNRCPDDKNGRVGDNGTHKYMDLGFYISLGLGFCAGFWAVCVSLILKNSWRHAYFQFFNNIHDWLWVTIVVFTNKIKRRFQIKH